MAARGSHEVCKPCPVLSRLLAPLTPPQQCVRPKLSAACQCLSVFTVQPCLCVRSGVSLRVKILAHLGMCSAAPSLSCGTSGLSLLRHSHSSRHCVIASFGISRCDAWALESRRVGSVVVECTLRCSAAACGTLVPGPRTELSLLHCKTDS